jgi:MAF protein
MCEISVDHSMLESLLIMKAPLLILASNSPRRRQLIQLLGLPYEVHPADVDEAQFEGEDAESYVRRLALGKANAVAAQHHGMVVAADTIVLYGKTLLGKPKDADDARAMLTCLRGRQHQVYSAITLVDTGSGRTLADLCKTEVPMRQYTDEEMEAYIASGDPLDKAGAYAIQHAGFNPVEALSGCYASVMGFPLCHVTRTLRSLHVWVAADVPTLCQEALVYTCPVFEAILACRE